MNLTANTTLQENPLTHQNITYVDFYLHKLPVAAVFTISYLLIFLVCMLGNGVVCFIVMRSKNMRTVTNLFILNLAISDLLVGIFCMPTTLVDNIITGQNTHALAIQQTVVLQCCSSLPLIRQGGHLAAWCVR